MICDTTFLGDLFEERQAGRRGPAAAFLAAQRQQRLLISVISVGELAVIFEDFNEARKFLSPFRILRLTPEIAYVAAAVDREQMATGRRLGENDNWIAGFCRYYGQPVVSRDVAFDRVGRLRRVAY